MFSAIETGGGSSFYMIQNISKIYASLSCASFCHTCQCYPGYFREHHWFSNIQSNLTANYFIPCLLYHYCWWIHADFMRIMYLYSSGICLWHLDNRMIIRNDSEVAMRDLGQIRRSLQYIPRNMHTVLALLCFVVVIHWLSYPYPSGLLRWHCGNLTIAPVPAKQPWWIWVNSPCEFIMNDYITTTKQSTTKPCAYLLGYTVYHNLTQQNVNRGHNSWDVLRVWFKVLQIKLS